MRMQLSILQALSASSLGGAQLLVSVTVVLCVLAVMVSVAINFMEARRGGVLQEKRSVVATFSMSLFFLLFYMLLRFRIGELEIENLKLRLVLLALGTAVILTGCVVNILGRFWLKGNWADHIRLYAEQTLVTSGPYKLVRHPLYASLIWMFMAASLIYLNWAGMLSTVMIFVPFMYYRARQEEFMLSARFPEYQEYRGRVGMFFPRIGGLWNSRMNR
jgi:protein-S-isoprenylcysteine O-methyltransferase Ste14